MPHRATGTIPVTPLSVLWEVTGRCHLHCLHCAATEFAPRGSASLGLDQMRTVAANLASRRPLQIAFAGGEPLLRTDLPQVVDVLTGLPNVVGLACYTSGHFLSTRGLPLLRRGVSMCVSLEGITARQHDAIRGPGTFARTLTEVAWLLSARDTSAGTGEVALAFTVSSQAPDPVELLRFTQEIGVDRLIIQVMAPLGDATANPDLVPRPHQVVAFYTGLLRAAPHYSVPILTEGLRPLVVDHINRQLGTHYPTGRYQCPSGSSRLVIQPDGTALPCRCSTTPPDGADHRPQASLLDTQLDEILRLPAWRQRARDSRLATKPEQPCGSCPFNGDTCHPCAASPVDVNRQALAACAHVLSIRDAIPTDALHLARD